MHIDYLITFWCCFWTVKMFVVDIPIIIVDTQYESLGIQQIEMIQLFSYWTCSCVGAIQKLSSILNLAGI